jgi:hypothetical protein
MIRRRHLKAPTTEATVGFVVTVHRLVSAEGHLPQAGYADAGSFTDPRQYPGVWVQPPSRVSGAIVNTEAVAGQRVHRHT